MSYSALQLNTNALYQAVNQTAHGFSAGDVLRFNGTDFVLASNTSEANAAVVGIVSRLENANQFYLTQEGFVAGLTTAPTEGGGYVPGTLYYLSAVAGEMTAVKPTLSGSVEMPLYIAYTATSGFFFSGAGDLIKPSLVWSVVAANTGMVINNGYIINGAGSIDMLLPAVSAVGDIIKIATLGVNGCVITQNAGQSVNIVDETSTIGVGGTVTLQTTNGVLSGSITLVCLVADTVWKCIDGTGVWNPA